MVIFQSELAPKFNIMIKELQADSDIVIMSRYIPGGGDERLLLRSLVSKYFNLFARLILRMPIKDLTNSIFLMKRKVLDEVTFLGYGHGEFFIEFIYKAHKRGLKIFEVPFVQPPDIEKMSKTASNIFRFFCLGFYYLTAIVHSLTRRD